MNKLETEIHKMMVVCSMQSNLKHSNLQFVSISVRILGQSNIYQSSHTIWDIFINNVHLITLVIVLYCVAIVIGSL